MNASSSGDRPSSSAKSPIASSSSSPATRASVEQAMLRVLERAVGVVEPVGVMTLR